MPAGCEFICDNKECTQYRSSISISGHWPIGKIEEIIGILSKNPLSLKGIKKEYYNKLLEYKKEGIKFASIVLPNSLEVPIIGYRLSFWSEKAKCLYQMDIETNGKLLSESIPDISSICPTICPNKKCIKRVENCELKPFEKVISDGICCPFCNKKMIQDRWFSNDQ